MTEPYREQPESKRRLPTLESIGVATPCKMRWDDMNGDGRVRFCGTCEKSVFNIAGMTRADAQSLIHDHLTSGTEVCIRLYKRADGTVLTADCPVGRRARIRWRIQQAFLTVGILVFLAALAVKLLGPRVQEAAVGSAAELK